MNVRLAARPSSRRNASGFTLMEVCVALAVLAFGSLAVGRYLDGFNRVRSVEREQAKILVAAVQTVEEFVRNPPPCTDSVIAQNRVEVTLSAVPGAVPLAWVQVTAEKISRVRLRRLVRCRKIRCTAALR